MSHTLPPLLPVLAAHPDLARTDRIAVALAMSADQFSIDDIARITSIRRQVIIGLRQQTLLPPRPEYKRAVHSNRTLGSVVDLLAAVAWDELPRCCQRLGIHLMSGLGIFLAIDYARRPPVSGEPRRLRCPGCEQTTTHHPCQHCGTAWLTDAGLSVPQ